MVEGLINNVTKDLKFEAFVDENEVIYLSTKDIANFFDEDIFYDNKWYNDRKAIKCAFFL